MRDRLEFSARTLDGALESAVRSLGGSVAGLEPVVATEERGFLGFESRRVTILVAEPAVVSEEIAGKSSSAGDSIPRDEATPVSEGRRRMEPTVDVASRSALLRTVTEVLTLAGLEVEALEADDEDSFVIELSGPDQDLLTEDDGRVLGAIQYLVGRMQRRNSGSRLRLRCDDLVSDRDSELLVVVDEAVQRAQDGDEVLLPAMNAYERRLVHIRVGEIEGLVSESEGTGSLKRVLIRLADERSDERRRPRRRTRGGRGPRR